MSAAKLSQHLHPLEGGEFKAYRNIATCDPSQDLFDDVSDPEDFEALQYLDNISSGIDHSLPAKNRVFQYGRIEDSMACFDEQFWNWGRFSKRNYGVWYGALEEKTSELESLSHRPEIDPNDFLNADGPIIQARRMFRAHISAKQYVDLRPFRDTHPDLLSSDYSFCQELGQYAVDMKLDLYLAPSAQNPGGTTLPVFCSGAIISDKPIRTYLNIFPRDGSQPRTFRES